MRIWEKDKDSCYVENVSVLTGRTHIAVIQVEANRLAEWVIDDRRKRPFIQEVFPDLTEDEREFILSGATTEEWNDEYGGDE